MSAIVSRAPVPAVPTASPSAQRLWPWATLPVLFIVLAASVPLLSDYGLEIAFRLLLLITLAEAWNLLAGYGGLVSLGTASFFGLGAYTLTKLLSDPSDSIILAMLAGGVVAALMALLVSRAVFRLRGLYFTVGTLALAEALRLFMVNYRGLGGASGLFLAVDPPAQREMVWLALGLLAFATLVVTLATATRFSILLRAVRDDEDAANQIGIRPFRIKLIAFLLASTLTGMAGALQALKVGTVEPYGTFGIQWTVAVLSVVIIGGQGLRLGPAVGAVFLVALSELLAEYPALQLALTGAILIGVIRLAPLGLVGLVQRLLARKKGGTR